MPYERWVRLALAKAATAVEAEFSRIKSTHDF